MLYQIDQDCPEDAKKLRDDVMANLQDLRQRLKTGLTDLAELRLSFSKVSKTFAA
jgi:hypothetical protein